jgi:outer membrane protein assembly factor BamB
MTDDHHSSDTDTNSSTDQPYSEPTAVAPTPPNARGGIRWWIAGLIVAATAVASFIGLQWAGDDLSTQSLATVIPWMLGCVLLVLWWVLLSGARWGTRFKGVGLLIACFVLFVGLFRWEGQAGNFVPHFAFRFSPTPEERAVEYFDNADDSAAAVTDNPGTLEVTTDDWPRFGGANEDHIVTDAPIRRDWDTNPPKELWRHPIGPGWSSFSVVGDLLFTQEQRGELEAVVCYDANSGKQIWLHTDEARFHDPASGAGPRSTPTIHDSKLYALGGTGILNCLNPVSGTLHWSKNIVEDADTSLIEWGMAGAPLVYGDAVIVNPGGKTGSVAAYDRLTGNKLWAGAGDQATYASPQVAELDGVPQILIFCSTGLCGHDASSGEKLWLFPWTNMTKLNIAQPIVLPDNSVFISSGYGGGSARLDITKGDDGWKVDPQWTAPDRFRLKFNGGIYRDGFVYGLDEGILACFDVDKGKRTWKRGRYNFGQIVMVGDDLVVVTESGKVVLVEVTPKQAREVARFQAIQGKTWNHPLINRGRLYIRNGEEAACYDLSL